MMFIKDQKNNSRCYYQAHVWFDKHSHQCGCFAVRAAAEQWAQWLHRRMATDDLLKGVRKKAE